jgi:hypothetical protein
VKKYSSRHTFSWLNSSSFDDRGSPFPYNFGVSAKVENSKNIDDVASDVKVYTVRKSFHNGHPDLISYNSK